MIQKLQIALDLLNLDRALSIAKEAVDAVDDCWIEAGTPLIKSEGMDAIRKLKDTFPNKTIIPTTALSVMQSNQQGNMELKLWWTLLELKIKLREL